MSKESQVMQSVASVIDFIKTQIDNDLMTALGSNTIKIEKTELEKISRVCKSSIDASFFKASDQIINSVKS